MKICRVEISGGNVERGLIVDNVVYKLEGDALKPGAKIGALENVRLKCPAQPGKVVCVGLNYRDHAKEMGLPLPENPILFLKPSTSVIGPGDKIIYPPQSQRVDYEGELGVVISRRCRNVKPEESAAYILGYTCVNDVTARDLQAKDGQWTRAKGFDSFAPIGPWVESELDPSNLKIQTILNGKVVQDSNTSNLIFNVPTLVAFISGVMTLEPGDVIATGTTSGIGPMNPGDKVTVSIEGIGELSNTIASPV
jgi:2-keto-4-pentenoate hydratase/2-oxohepta-3-ene-1,7-dioic acid hydratase in catechol pathway